MQVVARGEKRGHAVAAVVPRVAVESFHAVDIRRVGGKQAGAVWVRLIDQEAVRLAVFVKLMQRGGRFAYVVRQVQDVLFFQTVDEEIFVVPLEANLHARQDGHIAVLAGGVARSAETREKLLARLAGVAFSGQVMVGDDQRAVTGRMHAFHEPRGRKPAAAADLARVRVRLKQDAAHLKQYFSTLL